MKVPRRTAAPRGGGRDRARPAGGRGAPRPATPAMRGRVPHRAEPVAEDAREWRFRRTAFTGRAAVLALVVCALALALAYPIQRYVQQRQEIAELAEQVEDGEARVRALEEEKARWADPNYVRQQARKRLHFVMPGETGYVVLGGDERDGPAQHGSAESREKVEPQRQAWYGKLWSSVAAADTEPDRTAGTGKKPAGHIGPGSAPKPGATP